MTFLPSSVARNTAICGLIAASLGCGAGTVEHGAVDLAMTSAYRPTRGHGHGQGLGSESALAVGEAAPRYHLLGGDLHCHVLPPDDATHVSRSLHDTVALAKREGLDFVVLTPHVAARFQEDEDARREVVREQRALKDAISGESLGGLMVVPGFEYTDHELGHAGVAFADLERVLESVSVQDARKSPGLFFERWVEKGGLLVVNHPLVTALPSGPSIARADLSWRPLTAPGPGSGGLRGDIDAIDRLASGFEVYNLTATHLRDRYLQGDTDKTLLATLLRLDQEIPLRNRRMTPIGGTDSHSYHLRPTTYVLAETRSIEGVRAAVAAGRTCVRAPEACSLEARVPDQRFAGWSPLGANLITAGEVELRATGDDIELYRDGAVVATPASGATVRVPVPAGKCSVLRARVGRGFSAPIYANCDIRT